MAGTTTVSAKANLSASGTVNVTGGVLKGTGTVGSAVNNTGGTVEPGASPGTLNVNGSFTQSGNGTLVTDIAGTTAGVEYDRLAVSGQATLGGTLEIVTDDNFDPVDAQMFQVVTANPVTGTFGTVEGSEITPTRIYDVLYNANNVTLEVRDLETRNVALSTETPKIKFGKGFKIKVTINSSENSCKANQDVDIMRKIGGQNSFSLLQTVQTNSTGVFALNLTGDKSATYRAEVDENDSCVEDTSPTLGVEVKVKVNLVSSDAKVKKDEKFTLTTTVTPCGDHADFEAKLFRRVGRTGKRGFFLEKKPLNNQCKATFQRKIKQPEQFKVEVKPPASHKDHHQGVSAWVPVGIK